jgi:hypothetical protein
LPEAFEAAAVMQRIVGAGVQDHLAGEGVVVQTTSPSVAKTRQDAQSAHVDDQVAEAGTAERPGEPG